MTHAFIDHFGSTYDGKFKVVWCEGSRGARESKGVVAKNVIAWAKENLH